MNIKDIVYVNDMSLRVGCLAGNIIAKMLWEPCVCYLSCLCKGSKAAEADGFGRSGDGHRARPSPEIGQYV